MQLFKKQIPIAVAFIAGFLMFLQIFIPTRVSADAFEDFTQWTRIIASFTLLLGIYSLLNHHFHKMKRKVEGWGFSVIVYVGFFAMTIAGFAYGMDNPSPVTETINGVETPVQTYMPFMWMFSYMFVPMQATMFSVLAFYIASAAYRAFRARTREATVLLITAIIVMLGRVPLGAKMIPAKIQDVEFLPWLTEWILNNPSMAAQRGIMMGIGLGVIATSLRIIFGIERTYMGGGD
jgi:hypothetical protein